MSKPYFFLGVLLILLGIAAGAIATIQAVDRVVPKLSQSVLVRQGTPMVTYSEDVTCHGRIVTVTTTCAEGETSAQCWARHQAAVDAAKVGMGC